MLTTLDTTRLIPRVQPENSPSNPANPSIDGPVFTLPELLEILEDRPDMREALRQALIEAKNRQQQQLPK